MSKTDTPIIVRLEDYRPPDWRVVHVDLAFDLDPQATRVRSRLQLEGTAGKPIRLDGEDLKLVSIALDGTPVPAEAVHVDADALTLHGVTTPACLVEIEVEIAPAANTRLEGLYVSSGTFCTQCEAEGFRRITFFPDRPDVMATYSVTARADKAACPVILSNGNPVSTRDLGDGRHEAVWDDPHPKPAYLFALVAGDLGLHADRFTTASGREVTLGIYCEHGNEARCAYAMDALKRSMRWDEEVYGREYDLDVFNIVAVSDFNMGAMENKGLNVFNAKYILADPETATDADYAFIEAVVAHEYFHNWTGNRVTCRDWFQLSLKEGLTVFRDQQFSADMRSPAVRRIESVRSLRARQYPEDASPLAHPVRPSSYIEINNFYTPTVYEKGAEVIRMMHTLLGPAGYRRGMDLYFDRHDGQAVTCDDFVRAMEDANDADLRQFRLWYSQAGTPVVTAAGVWHADARRYDLTLTQACPPTPGQPEKRPMVIPIAVGLMGPDGRDLPLGDSSTTTVLRLTETTQTFRFDDLPAPPHPSLNRGFSAPIRLEMARSPEDYVFAMAHDADPFNRWEAGQRYATDLLRDMAVRGTAELPPTAGPLVTALGRVLADPALDRAFAALMLALPSEDQIAESMEVVDVDAVHAAREALRRRIAGELAAPLTAVYQANRSNRGAVSLDAASAGRRALCNAALGYLGLTDSELAATHYRDAASMTDRIAALSLLTDSDSPARVAALDDFLARFQADALVMDKWLAVQAMSSRPDTLDTVERLRDHPVYSARNPNKVRALVGSFSSGNSLRFHAADGRGYAFLADRVIELDRLNPQTAARLLQPMRRWRRFDPGRQARMRAELERVLATPGLSRDVFEVASKSLN